MLRILKWYRDQEDPDMGLVEDKPYETYSKTDMLEACVLPRQESISVTC